jgi:hypothetical protein
MPTMVIGSGIVEGGGDNCHCEMMDDKGWNVFGFGDMRCGVVG